MAWPRLSPKIPRKLQRFQQLVETSPVPIEGADYYPVAGFADKVNYFVAGKEDAEITLVFVHGFTLAASAWQFQIAHVADRVRCIAMDLRGHGGSCPCPPADCTIDGAADDVVAAIQAANEHGPIIIVGHSLGGMVVLNALRRFPKLKDRTVGAILISTAVESFAEQGAPQILAFPVVDKVHKAIEASPEEALEFRAAIAKFVAPALAASIFVRETPSEIVQFHAKLINSTPIETYIGYLDDLGEHNEKAAAKSIDGIPGLVMVGADDLVTPLSQSERIVQMWDGAGLQVIPEAGHMLPLESPVVVNKALDYMLDKATAKERAEN